MITLVNPTLPYGFAKRHGVILLDAGEIAVIGLREGADPTALVEASAGLPHLLPVARAWALRRRNFEYAKSAIGLTATALAATITDANVILGYISPDRFNAGTLTLDVAAAISVRQRLRGEHDEVLAPERRLARHARGIEVAERKGDKQAAKEMNVFLKRLGNG